MRRILVLLTVVALMVVMLAMSVAPAFAAKDSFNCRLSNKFSTGQGTTTPGTGYDRNGDGYYCIYTYTDPFKLRYADNHPAIRN